MVNSFRPDPKPEPKEKKSSRSFDPFKIGRYSCIYCHERYEMMKGEYQKRTLGPLKKCCKKVDCMAKAALKAVEKKKEEERIADKKRWEKKRKEWENELSGSKMHGMRKKGKHKDPLQIAINKIVKLIDAEHGCIARPFLDANGYDAGHVFSTGSWESLTYHLWNIHKQSIYSNRDKGGEQGLMLDGIEVRYGKERREFVEGLRSLYPVMKLKDWEKKEALKKANKILREWEKNPLTRDEVNSIIGIYKLG